MNNRFPAYSGHTVPSSTSTFDSADHRSFSPESKIPSYTNLADVSLSSGKAPLLAFGQHRRTQADQLREGNSSNGQAVIPTNQAFDQRMDHYNSPAMDVDRAPASPSATTSRYQVHNSNPRTDCTLLQVPTIKRQRTTDDLQGRRLETYGKKQKTVSSAPTKPAVIHQAKKERLTESHSHIIQDPLQTIRNVVAKNSGGSEDVLSSITRILSGFDVKGQNGQHEHQDALDDLDAKSKKKYFECDQCHKRMARQCDLK